jgi:hypothetical protein
MLLQSSGGFMNIRPIGLAYAKTNEKKMIWPGSIPVIL